MGWGGEKGSKGRGGGEWLVAEGGSECFEVELRGNGGTEYTYSANKKRQ